MTSRKKNAIRKEILFDPVLYEALTKRLEDPVTKKLRFGVIQKLVHQLLAEWLQEHSHEATQLLPSEHDIPIPGTPEARRLVSDLFKEESV